MTDDRIEKEERTNQLELEELNPCTVVCMAFRPEELFSIPAGTKIVEGCRGQNYQEVGIPEGVEILANWAFAQCQRLEWVSLPQTLRIIGEHAFRECVSLTEITIPDGVKEIRGGTFFGCSALGTATLPPGLREIGAYAFSCCDSLREIVIPDGVQALGRAHLRAAPPFAVQNSPRPSARPRSRRCLTRRGSARISAFIAGKVHDCQSTWD